MSGQRDAEIAADAMDGNAIPMVVTTETPAVSREQSATQVQRIATAASEQRKRIGVAESLTSGALSAALGAAPRAGEWFSGGIVAYRPEVKFEALHVSPGPVVTAAAALQMARGCARALSSDVTIAITGVGGPGPEEGHRAGTVFIAVRTPTATSVQEHWFPGDPQTVIERTVAAALHALADALQTDGP